MTHDNSANAYRANRLTFIVEGLVILYPIIGWILHPRQDHCKTKPIPVIEHAGQTVEPRLQTWRHPLCVAVCKMDAWVCVHNKICAKETRVSLYPESNWTTFFSFISWRVVHPHLKLRGHRASCVLESRVVVLGATCGRNSCWLNTDCDHEDSCNQQHRLVYC